MSRRGVLLGILALGIPGIFAGGLALYHHSNPPRMHGPRADVRTATVRFFPIGRGKSATEVIVADDLARELYDLLAESTPAIDAWGEETGWVEVVYSDGPKDTFTITARGVYVMTGGGYRRVDRRRLENVLEAVRATHPR